LTRQFRPGMEEVLLELPGGGLGKDEDPATGAKRELLEETGFQGDLQYINTSYISAYTGHTTISFVATGCKKVQEPEHQNEDGEWIEVEFLSLPDFREHLRAGKLTDVKTGYLGLDFLGLL
jgi:ADP-ribose pyrophosphatase